MKLLKLINQRLAPYKEETSQPKLSVILVLKSMLKEEEAR
jgi:hypothetical protein